MLMFPYIANLLAAMLLGALIGAERQWRQRMAGLRTNALVATGAAVFILSSISTSPDSPGRIAAQVVSGIGFLGAGDSRPAMETRNEPPGYQMRKDACRKYRGTGGDAVTRTGRGRSLTGSAGRTFSSLAETSCAVTETAVTAASAGIAGAIRQQGPPGQPSFAG